jgi:hypothetical protein
MIKTKVRLIYRLTRFVNQAEKLPIRNGVLRAVALAILNLGLSTM